MKKLFDIFRMKPLNLFREKPSVSFCITCRDRMWQIRETLPKNLKDNYGHSDRVDFVLVDFASCDGLRDWVSGNFEEELKSGYLKYYYTEEMPQWNVCVAKNTAHMMAGGEIVVNLDCDNFTGPGGGDYVSRKMRIFGPDKIVLHMFSGEWMDGTFGRIAMSKRNFLKVGGYYEDFRKPAYEDTDIVNRLRAMGFKRIKNSNRRYLNAIPNAKGEGVIESRSEWMEVNRRNGDESRKNIAEGRLVANEGRPIGVQAVRMFQE